MFKFHFEVSPSTDAFERYSRAFSRFGEGLKDYSALFERMADEFYLEIGKAFASEGGSGATGAWQELSPKYAAQKQRRWGFVHPILQASGALKKSFTRGGAENITAIAPLYMTVGSGMPRSVYHQKGGKRLPRRPPVALGENFKRSWDRTIHAFLFDAQKKAFGPLIRDEIAREQSFVRKIDNP